jgi:hypothetical protein
MNKSIQRKFSVRWFNESSGEGVLRDTETMRSYMFYACNVEGANSLYPQLVTNISLNKGDTVFGTISEDTYMLRECGIIDIKLPTKLLILKHKDQPDYRDAA